METKEKRKENNDEIKEMFMKSKKSDCANIEEEIEEENIYKYIYLYT